MTQLQKKKLRKNLKRSIRYDKTLKLYLLNLQWYQIRLQKARRRRRTLKKLFIMKRLRELNLSLRAA
jgi:hypothetical protein